MITFLYIVIAVALFVAVAWSMTPADVMPSSCPSCMNGARRDLFEEDTLVPLLRDAWYRRNSDGSVRCWACGKRFREHPNGTLVEDRG